MTHKEDTELSKQIEALYLSSLTYLDMDVEPNRVVPAKYEDFKKKAEALINRETVKTKEQGRLEAWGVTYGFLHSADRDLCDEWEEEYKLFEASLKQLQGEQQ